MTDERLERIIHLHERGRELKYLLAEISRGGECVDIQINGSDPVCVGGDILAGLRESVKAEHIRVCKEYEEA